VSTICCGSGDPQKAQKILALLLKKKADLPGIPEALLKLGQSYRNKGMKDNWLKCLRVIHSQYPHTVEARIAKKELAG
jgi:TolA-binding protein